MSAERGEARQRQRQRDRERRRRRRQEAAVGVLLLAAWLLAALLGFGADRRQPPPLQPLPYSTTAVVGTTATCYCSGDYRAVRRSHCRCQHSDILRRILPTHRTYYSAHTCYGLLRTVDLLATVATRALRAATASYSSWPSYLAACRTTRSSS